MFWLSNRNLLLLFGGFVLLVWLTNCKPEEVPSPPTITTVSPISAPIGATIVISGTNFDSNPANNSVKFGDKPAVVVASTSTQLTVVIPQGAGIVITVTVNGMTSQGYTILPPEPRMLDVTGEIRANTTFYSSNIYLLRGFVYVTNGATLTIEPGTVVKGGAFDQDPLGQNRAAVLIIEPGAKLIANGTAQQPIVFTSSKPIGQRRYGDWGGIVLIGKAPHNRPAAATFEFGIRGTMGTFNEPTDNSGSLQYVRIEFGGTALSAISSSESKGLNLYGVGSGTTIDYVQVSFSMDDSFAWFGGTVNARHLVSFRAFDDDFDTDFGYTGKVQFGLALRDPEAADQSGSNCLESDNFNPGENTAAQGPMAVNNGLPLTQPIFANISSLAFSGTPNAFPTPKGSGPFQSAMHLRRNTATSVYNSVFAGWPEGLRLDGTTTGTLANVNNGLLDLKGIVLANVGGASVTGLAGITSTTAVLGAGQITNQQAQTFFLTPSRQNQLVPLTDLPSLLLNPATFNLTNPAFLPQTGSPLLQGAITGGKLTDSFFTPTSYRGAFGPTDWTLGWTNWNPQNTPY